MVTEDQHEVIEFLRRPGTHGPDCAHVDEVVTHSAMVFLAGPRALKMKRAVRYDYLDFSTAERRRAGCEAEAALNRRLAPAIYRGVVAVTREADGRLALGGAGAPVEWLVDMTRFDERRLADRLAEAGALPVAAMAALASSIAAFHAGAAPRTDKGGAAGMLWVADGNRASFDEFGDAVFPAAARARLVRDTARVLQAASARLDRRRAAGLVRQCHGDLHLRNIVVLDGVPTLFDAVEFNDDIAGIDVFYDLAFLLMDLWRRRLPGHANAVLNEYLRRTGDLDGLALLPLFLLCRAAVRAKTGATTAALAEDPAARSGLVDTARSYLTLAQTFLQPAPPVLLAIGGLSGSGKSTAAAQVAPALGAAPGALHLRTDVIRKDLCGVPLLERLPAEAYTADVSARVYDRLTSNAATALAAGHAVVCDGVLGDAAARSALAGVAHAAGAPFVGVWLEAPEAALLDRVERRRDDVSDATGDVVRRQVEQAQAPTDWTRVDASGSADATAARVLDVMARATGRASRA
jgi:aminoglycoside phosphotransferase family enzyme/predicted kinase